MAFNSIDRNTALCLACSSSLPPLKSSDRNIFITPCCQQPICPSCIASSPRLARYNPCLACLGGIGVIASGSSTSQTASAARDVKSQLSLNLNGAVRDEDTFVLGDDSDDEEAGINQPSSPLPPYEPGIDPWKDASNPNVAKSVAEIADPAPAVDSEIDSEETPGPNTTPYKYYLGRSDTLQGISLRFKVDSHEICKLNNLPSSVIRNTPHLLHTRAFIILPATTKPHPSLQINEADDKTKEVKRVRERAEKNLQTLTKEVDWRVAKAYVALAEDPGEQEEWAAKIKEKGDAVGPPDAGSCAIARYLDDDEWEIEERRAGRTAGVIMMSKESNR